MIKKETAGFGRDDLAPPPCWIVTRLPPSASPGPEAALMPDPGPGEVPAAVAALPPAFPEFVELLFWQASIPVTEASGKHFQDPAPAKPPKLYPPLPLPVSTDKKGRERLELSSDCALPESWRERKRTVKRFTVLAATLGVFLGPSGKPHLPQGQDSPSASPSGGPRHR